MRVQYFVGECSDDYGLRSISFNYRIRKEGGKQEELVNIPISRPGGKQAGFEYAFDLREIGLSPGDEVIYYFEVYDNDGVSGPKASRTNLMSYAMPTVKELEAIAEKNDDEIKENL